MSAIFSDTPPLLLFVNMQNEYVLPGRKHTMSDAGRVQQTCGVLLDHWREQGWPVAHLRRVAQAAWFNPASNLTDWLDRFKPRPGELTFDHSLPSAYSSPSFADYMANIGSVKLVMAGFSLDETILATVIDGFHRGNNWSVATGASATKSSTTTPEKYFRMSLIETIRRYAKIVDSSALLEDPCNLKSVPLSAEGI